MIRFLGHLCFLECHCLFSAFEASSGLRRVWFPVVVSTPGYSGTDPHAFLVLACASRNSRPLQFVCVLSLCGVASAAAN